MSRALSEIFLVGAFDGSRKKNDQSGKPPQNRKVSAKSGKDKKVGNGRNTVSIVLFHKREPTEFCGKLGEFCNEFGELALAK